MTGGGRTSAPATGHSVSAGDSVSFGTLQGLRVLIPRAAKRSTELVDLLLAAGATPVAIPLIAIEPPDDVWALDRALVELSKGTFDWVAFTSVSAVDAVLHRAAGVRLSPIVPVGTRVAAVGRPTAASLRRAGLPVDLVPSAGGSATALARIWPHPSGESGVLLPRSDIAAPTLPNALSALGYRVQPVVAYRTVVQPLPAELVTDLTAGSFDAVLFTSPSTVRATAGVAIAPDTVLCAIGASTAREAADIGRPVHVTADEPTASGLLRALGEHTPAAHRVASPHPPTSANPRHVEA